MVLELKQGFYQRLDQQEVVKGKAIPLQAQCGPEGG